MVRSFSWHTICLFATLYSPFSCCLAHFWSWLIIFNKGSQCKLHWLITTLKLTLLDWISEGWLCVCLINWYDNVTIFPIANSTNIANILSPEICQFFFVTHGLVLSLLFLFLSSWQHHWWRISTILFLYWMQFCIECLTNRMVHY